MADNIRRKGWRVVGTCDWGDCDKPTAAMRWTGDEWLSVCEEDMKSGPSRWKARVYRLTDEDLELGVVSLTAPPKHGPWEF